MKVFLFLGDPTSAECFHVDMEFGDQHKAKEFRDALRIAGKIIWDKMHPPPDTRMLFDGNSPEDYMSATLAHEAKHGRYAI